MGGRAPVRAATAALAVAAPARAATAVVPHWLGPDMGGHAHGGQTMILRGR